MFDLKEFDEKIDPFVLTQLKSLKRIYKIKKSDENCFIIKSKLNVDLETIKSRLQRLFNIEPKLNEFLCNHKEKMSLKSDKLKTHGHFVSRFYELKHLDEYLKEYSCQTVYIHGPSGCGKTYLVEQFAAQLNQQQKHLVRIINARNRFTLENAFKFIAEVVREENMDLSNLFLNKYKKFKRCLNDYVSLNELKIFIILDDLREFDKEFLESIRSGFDRESIKFIITSQIETINFKNFKEIKLTLFDRHSCMKLIEKRNLNYDWDRVLGKMSDDRDHIEILPLKLNNLLRIVEHNQNWTYDGIENPFSLLKDESPFLCECLACFSLLDGRNISFELIKEIFADETDLDTKLNKLSHKSMLQYDQERKCYIIHEQTQSDIKKTGLVSETKLIQFLSQIILALNTLLNMDEIRKDKFKLNIKYESLLNHCDKVLRHEATSQIKMEHLESLNDKLAEIMEHIVLNYDLCLYYLMLNLDLKQHLNPNKHDSIAFTLSNIANVYSCQNRFEDALTNYQKALDIFKLTLPSDHIKIADTLINIGDVYRNQNRLEEALDLYWQALKIYQLKLPSNHISLASTLNNIGLIYSNHDRLDNALNNYNESLRIKKLILASNHCSIGQTINNIANVYRKQNRYEEALVNYKEALSIFKLTNNHDKHSSIATLINNMGILNYKQNRLDEALVNFEEALEIFEEILPLNHFLKAQTIHNIGLVYSDQNRLDDALENYRKALAIYKITLPLDHSSIAEITNNIANVYSKQNRLDEALINFEEALRISKISLPSNHSSIAMTINNIANIYSNQNRLDDALKSYEEALRIKKLSLPSFHSSIAQTINNIGHVYWKQNRLDEALKKFEEALQMKKKLLAPNHCSIAQTLNNIGLVFVDQNKLDEAYAYFQEALTIFRLTLPEKHPHVDMVLNEMKKIK